MFFHCLPELADFFFYVFEVGDGGHREAEIRAFDFRLKKQPVKCLDCRFGPASGKAVKRRLFVDTLAEHFGADDFLFPPDDEVFERVFACVFAEQPTVQGGDAVNQADVHTCVELAHLVKIDGREQSVSPAEGGVRVDDKVGDFFCLCDDVFENASAKRVQPL